MKCGGIHNQSFSTTFQIIGAGKLSFSEVVNSNKAIFYGTNGTGKSFISRAFRLCTTSKTNNVFNSDYVEENIKAKHYSPDRKIEGYILGKVQIDLTEEKKNLEALSDEINEYNGVIDKAIDEAKSFLIENHVKSTTKEFSAITRDNVEHGFGYEQVETVDECIQKIKMVESLPDNLQDIRFSLLSIDMIFLNEIEGILNTVYPKSEWNEEFVTEYKVHQHFIEIGLDHDNSDKICPFCKRTYNSEALELINRYNQYRQDQEAEIIGKLRRIQQSVNRMSESPDVEQKKINDALIQLKEIRQYFPSLANLKLKLITKNEDYKTVFQTLSDCRL